MEVDRRPAGNRGQLGVGLSWSGGGVRFYLGWDCRVTIGLGPPLGPPGVIPWYSAQPYMWHIPFRNIPLER